MRGSDASSHHFFIGIVALDKIKKAQLFSLQHTGNEFYIRVFCELCCVRRL